MTEGAAVGDAEAVVGEALGVDADVVDVGATTVGDADTGVGVLFLFLPPQATRSRRTRDTARRVLFLMTFRLAEAKLASAIRCLSIYGRSDCAFGSLRLA